LTRKNVPSGETWATPTAVCSKVWRKRSTLSLSALTSRSRCRECCSSSRTIGREIVTDTQAPAATNPIETTAASSPALTNGARTSAMSTFVTMPRSSAATGS
jgi:hypothetical protein